MNRELAKKWEAYDGAVKVFMLPYKRFGFASAYNDMMGGEYNGDAAIFAATDWCFVDAEISSNAPAVWRAFKQYVGKRKPHDLKGNWELFQEIGSVTLLEEWQMAFLETRETLLSETYYDEAAEDEDPKA